MTNVPAFHLGWFSDPDNEAQLKRLTWEVDSLAERTDVGEPEFVQLLSIFERFPNDDGYESFWSIVHTLEAFPGYEPHLIKSIERTPAELSLTMVNRLLNAGVSEVSGLSLIALLEAVASSSKVDRPVAKAAQGCLSYQAQRGRVA